MQSISSSYPNSVWTGIHALKVKISKQRLILKMSFKAKAEKAEAVQVHHLDAGNHKVNYKSKKYVSKTQSQN